MHNTTIIIIRRRTVCVQDWKIQFKWKKLEHPVNFATERIGFSWKAMSSSWNFVTLSQDAITNVFFAFSANTWHRAHYYTVVKQWQTTTLHCRSCVRSWLALDTWKLEVFALNEPLRIHAAVYFQNSRELTMPNTTREFVERTSSSRRVCQSLNMVYGIERSANNTWQIHLDLPHLRDRLELLTGLTTVYYLQTDLVRVCSRENNTFYTKLSLFQFHNFVT